MILKIKINGCVLYVGSPDAGNLTLKEVEIFSKRVIVSENVLHEICKIVIVVVVSSMRLERVIRR